jgi:hypothetical protein
LQSRFAMFQHAIGIYNSKFPQFPTHLVVLGQHTLTWLAF